MELKELPAVQLKMPGMTMTATGLSVHLHQATQAHYNVEVHAYYVTLVIKLAFSIHLLFCKLVCLCVVCDRVVR